MAIRRTFYRILILYIGGVFVIGLVVPRTNSSLFVATQAKTGAAASPFVVAATLVSSLNLSSHNQIYLTISPNRLESRF